MRLQKRGVAGIVLVVFLLCSFTSVIALKTMPLHHDVGVVDKNKQYQQIFSIQNDGAKPEQVDLGYVQFSQYFESYVQMNPQDFVIYPGKTQNIQLILDVPSTFGPEIHKLRLMNTVDEEELFSMDFEIKGTPIHDLRLVDAIVGDIPVEELLPIDIRLKNDGNVISYATPVIIVEQDKQEVGRVSFESILQVLPQEEYELTLTYNDELPKGDYALRVIFDYNELYTTNELVRNFAVLSAENFMRILRKGKDLVVPFSDIGVEGATYTYEITRNNIVIHEDSIEEFSTEAVIDSQYFKEGKNIVTFYLNPERENRAYKIEVTVEGRNYMIFLVYGVLILIFLSLYINKASYIL